MTVGSLQHTGDEKGRATLPQHPPQATLTGSMGASHAAPAGHPGPSASTLNGPPPKYTSYRRNQLKLRGKDLADSAKARSARVQNMEKHRWYYLATGAIYIVIASLLMAIAFPDATQFALARLDKDAVLLDGFCSAAMDSTGNKSGCATAQALALANADYDVGASAAIGSFATLYMMHVVAAVMLFVAGIYFVILTWADKGVEVPETDEKGNTKRGRHRKDRTQLKKTVCITTLAVVNCWILDSLLAFSATKSMTGRWWASGNWSRAFWCIQGSMVLVGVAIILVLKRKPKPRYEEHLRGGHAI